MSSVASALRGDLPYKAVDARQINMTAKNPSCMRLRAILMAGTSVDAVLTQVFHGEDQSEQSIYALTIGNAFEAKLFESGAARLIQSLQEAGVLGETDLRVLNLNNIPDINSTDGAKRARALRLAAAETRRAIRARAEGHPNAPNIIIHAAMPLPLGAGAEIVLVRPDVLFARDGEWSYRVGEIKSFPSLGHLTDEDEVETAAAQAGVYAVTLEQVMEDLGIDLPVRPQAALILLKPPGMFAKTTIQDIERDMGTARRMLAQRPHSLNEIVSILGPGVSLDSQEAIYRIPATFQGFCRSFCPLWRICQDEARTRGDPSVLGKEVEELVRAVGSPQRAIALMHGAAPQNPVEGIVQRRLQAAYRELQEIQGAVA